MSTLLAGVSTQYIDRNGKTRMLNYSNLSISLMISPIPPIYAPQVSLDSIIITSLSQAVKFIKNKKLKIVKQDGTEKGKIKGLWIKGKVLNSGIEFAYIPIENSPPLRDADGNIHPKLSKPTSINPLKVEGESTLKTFRKQRLLATFIKQYVLFEYSQNPETFGENNFHIDSNHTYDIDSLDKKFIRGNDVMYVGNKLVIPSIKVRCQLLSYLKAQVLNNPNILKFKNKKFIDNYFVNPSDFNAHKNQIVFMNRKDVNTWIKNNFRKKFSKQITSTLYPTLTTPYFFKNTNIGKFNPVLIQNVINGDLRRALAVGQKWVKDRVNTGFNSDPIKSIDKIKFEVYDRYKYKDTNLETPSVLHYGGNNYGAILFFEP
ncbi:hypothetical protein OAG24_00510 [bacterium]|nr:hypothetical protein [bacterium]